jgi:molecular chaperone GrpE (heat shock protein)
VADYRNLQDRTAREAKATRDYALQGFIKDLLMSIDNIEHALLSVPADKLKAPGEATAEQVHKDLVNIHQGLQLTESVLMDVLKKHGVTRVDPAREGHAFDPNIHEAVFHAPMEGKKNGDVMHTQQKGFLLNGRVLRVSFLRFQTRAQLTEYRLRKWEWSRIRHDSRQCFLRSASWRASKVKFSIECGRQRDHLLSHVSMFGVEELYYNERQGRVVTTDRKDGVFIPSL